MKTPCDTKNKLKARITNLKKETIEKACKRLQSCLKAMVEANDDFF